MNSINTKKPLRTSNKLFKAYILALPDFKELFEVGGNADSVGIGAILTQLRKLVAYFSEKLSGSKLNNSTYNKSSTPF